ncbi:restriction endonuclease subunit S [Citrobacter freundii]|nr:restriction endonuclease subunit S [Citrobacter freundii]
MPWKQTTLGSVSSYAAYGMNSSAIEFDGVNKYIRITDIDDDTREFIPSPLTTPSGKLDNQYLLKKGDIVFARTGASVGKSYLYNEKDGKLYFAGFLIKFTINKANPYFVYNQIFTEKYRKWVKIHSMRSGQPGINAEEYKEFEFAAPALEEQTKIADFLSSVDGKITLLKNQYDLLCQYKKGMMQKIFSQKVRFKDESGEEFPEWQIMKLGEIAQIKRGASPRPITDPIWFDSLSNIGWVRISDVTKSNKYLLKTEQYVSDKGVKKSRLVNSEKIIMSICATIGKPICTTFDVCIHDGFVVFESLSTNTDFLYYYLSFIEDNWQRYGQPGTQVNLNVDIVSNERINIPSLSEQIKISQFLANIDNKLTSKKAELDKLKTWKQGLLQQMFV